MIKISVIIPVYNGELLLTRCLDSIFSQQGDFDLEVILIDDGSTDHSLFVAKNYRHSLKIIHQLNQGPASARNVGIANASGKYLSFIDSDDYWYPDFLLETVRFMEAYPQAIAVSVAQIHRTIKKTEQVIPTGCSLDSKNFQSPFLLDDFYDFWNQHNHVCTGAVLMQTGVVKKTGGQRIELRITEDLEFWAYLATFGPWGFIPRILFVSDGCRVTRKIGWVKKNKQRWASAPDLDQWEKRIIPALPSPVPEAYLEIRGRMAHHLAYFLLLSKRDHIARKIVRENRKRLNGGLLSKLLVNASNVDFLWALLCKTLYYREILRVV